jgi:MFS family permease
MTTTQNEILEESGEGRGHREPSLIVRLEWVQFLASMAVTATGLYVAILGKELGLSNVEIGTIVTVYAVTLVFSTYLFGMISDAYGTWAFLVGGFLFSGLMLFLHLLVFNYSSFLFIRLMTGVAQGVFPAALFSLASKANAKMGRFSAFQALGACLGLVVAGVLTSVLGTKALFAFGGVAVLAAFVLAIPLRDRGRVGGRVSIDPRGTIRENLGVYASLLIRHSGANLAWTFWPLYLLVLGANYFYVGVVGAINYLAQFLASFYFADKFGDRKEFDIGLILSGVTLVGLGLVANFLQAAILYAVIGGVWGFTYVGGMRTVLNRTNQRGATMAAYNSIVNLSTLLGPIMATVLIAFMDYRTTMYVAAALAFVSWIISLKIKN